MSTTEEVRRLTRDQLAEARIWLTDTIGATLPDGRRLDLIGWGELTALVELRHVEGVAGFVAALDFAQRHGLDDEPTSAAEPYANRMKRYAFDVDAEHYRGRVVANARSQAQALERIARVSLTAGYGTIHGTQLAGEPAPVCYCTPDYLCDACTTHGRLCCAPEMCPTCVDLGGHQRQPETTDDLDDVQRHSFAAAFGIGGIAS